MAVPAENQLKLRHFQLIVAIEETGSLRKAADSLGITQPAASNTLQELEQILNVSLFTRSRSGTEPTVTGRMLVERGRFLLGNLRATVQEVAYLRNGDVGDVQVGILPASALTIVPLAIKLAREQKPGMTIHVIEGATQQLLPALLRGELDMVVGRIPAVQVPAHVHREAMLAEPNEVVCRAGHELARRSKVTLKDLAGADWVLPEEGSFLRSDFRAAFVEAGITPPVPAVLTSSTVLRMTLIGTTDMLGMLTRRAALMNQGHGALVVLDVDFPSRAAPTLLLTRANTISAPAASAFAGFVRTAARSLHAVPLEDGPGARSASPA